MSYEVKDEILGSNFDRERRSAGKLALMMSAAIVVGVLGSAPAQAEGLYASIFGGANQMDDVGVSLTTAGYGLLTANAEAREGFVVGIALGYEVGSFLPGLKLELEAAYRHHSGVGTFAYAATTATTQPTTTAADSDLSTWSYMGNIWYEIDTGTWFSPYFGGGVGIVQTKVFPTASAVPTLEDDGWGYQLGVGANIAISEHASIGLGYRYLDAGEVPLTLGTLSDDVDFTQHSFIVGVNFDLN